MYYIMLFQEAFPLSVHGAEILTCKGNIEEAIND